MKKKLWQNYTNVFESSEKAEDIDNYEDKYTDLENQGTDEQEEIDKKKLQEEFIDTYIKNAQDTPIMFANQQPSQQETFEPTELAETEIDDDIWGGELNNIIADGFVEDETPIQQDVVNETAFGTKPKPKPEPKEIDLNSIFKKNKGLMEQIVKKEQKEKQKSFDNRSNSNGGMTDFEL